MRQEANTNRHLSEPTLTIVSLNVEGITKNKQDILSELSKAHKWDILCIQETHRDEHAYRPQIDGLRLVIEAPHPKHGSAIFVRPDLAVLSAHKTTDSGIEVLTIESGNFTVTSIYKPPGEKFGLTRTQNFNNQKTQFVVGDFNCHSTAWGYSETDHNGHLLEEWAEVSNLSLLHDPKLPCSFTSKIWKRGYNPDNCYVSCSIQDCCIKRVYEAIPKTQHKPIGVQVYSAVKTTTIPFRRRFNFKRANWTRFADDLDLAISNLSPTTENYDIFVEIVKKTSRRQIPRGCRQQFIPGLSDESKTILDKYEKLYKDDPFNEETIACGTALMATLSEARQTKWMDTLEKLDMTHSSKIAWNLVKKLNCDPTATKQSPNVTPDQVAHQLLLNGRSSARCRKPRVSRNFQTETNFFEIPFSDKELTRGIQAMKNGKAAGLDDMCVEQIKNFGPGARIWILELFNQCRDIYKIPKLWSKAKVIALLKPGKDPDSPQSYRPISLLCHLFKLYERLILHRITSAVDQKLIPQQAGFRPGKSCTSQILNLTEHIEDGYENKLITGLALVDLSSAYDTVNHRMLLAKLYDTLKDHRFVKIIQSLLQNRRFYVTLEGKKSRWRRQNNGLAQGSVLAPILFNLYTNDQPTPENTEHFLYADDLAITAQGRCFEDVEIKLELALGTMLDYYQANSLKPNPSKTEVSAFLLNTHQANRKLHVRWNGTTLTHTERPTYLGVTLDRSLTYKYHCEKTRQKVAARNNILRKLANSKWGAKPAILRTTAQALCYSTAEYACPVWSRSSHAKKVDVSLNETCRLVTGCMKPTPIERLHKAAGFASPNSRRKGHEFTERCRQTIDERHPLFGAETQSKRLKSRRRFLDVKLDDPPANYTKVQEMPSGADTEWTTWRTLNRIRTGVAPVKTNQIKWGLRPEADNQCDCGEIQNMEHLLACTNCPSSCSPDDLWLNKQEALDVAHYWAEKLQLPDTKK